MELAFAAPTTAWTLDSVIAQLTKQPKIDGVMLIGSLPAGTFNPFSDYDIVIVLQDTPLLWYVGVTCIDHRFTDLLFVAPTALEQIAALAAAVALNDPLTPIIRWLQRGQIVFDRTHALAAAQQHVTDGVWIDTYHDSDLFGSWFSTNYNLAQARRLLRSHDQLYQMATEIRMATHAHMDVWYSYFTIRRIADSGEKNALRYLQAHDPNFLQQYQRFIRATERSAKFALYELTATIALAPFGGLWAADTTAMNEAHMLSQWAELFDQNAE
jgi:hypothetical protein